jgi:ABC-type Fe3+ transport system permease subunit
MIFSYTKDKNYFFNCLILKKMQFILLVINGLLVLWLYFFVISRIKILSKRHSQDTKIKQLNKWYKVLKYKILVILLFLLLFSSSLIIIFF